MHVIAAKAAAFKEASTNDFVAYQNKVLDNAKVMVETFIHAGYSIVSGKTESHLFLVDLRNKKITGKFAENLLGKANIIVNKNSIPNDIENYRTTSGVRIGTPAITRRGFGKLEAKKVASWIIKILSNPKSTELLYHIRKKVISLC